MADRKNIARKEVYGNFDKCLYRRLWYTWSSWRGSKWTLFQRRRSRFCLTRLTCIFKPLSQSHTKRQKKTLKMNKCNFYIIWSFSVAYKNTGEFTKRVWEMSSQLFVILYTLSIYPSFFRDSDSTLCSLHTNSWEAPA